MNPRAHQTQNVLKHQKIETTTNQNDWQCSQLKYALILKETGLVIFLSQVAGQES
jgi:hypothetical protein